MYMYELVQAIPDVNTLLKLEPEQLGSKLLFLLRNRKFQSNIFHPGNLESELWPTSLLPGQQGPYPRDRQAAVSRAWAEAWAWLEGERFVVPAPEINGRNGWRMLSRRAEGFKDEDELAQHMVARTVPKQQAAVDVQPQIEHAGEAPSISPTKGVTKPRVFETATNTYVAEGTAGDGGCGTVYRVTDSDGQRYALKLLRETQSMKLKRFRNELAFCRRSNHARIIKVLDEGALVETRKMPFYVMPLYEETLRTLLRAGLVPGDVLPIFADILDGVEAAHLQGVFHRDLKPENLLVEMPDRRVVVADFGIAHFREEDLLTQVETGPGERLGNFRYSAPEQRNPAAAVDHHADIFALGLILNEMFTGEVPQGTGHRQIASAAPDFAYLDAIVEKMIRQNPKERPSSIADIKNELQLRGVGFVSQQKLDQARRAVVPASNPEDPLGGLDVKAMGFKYTPGYLLFQLQPLPPPLWMQTLTHLQSYRSFVGVAEPARIQPNDYGASVPAQPETVAEVARMVGEWVNAANAEYKQEIVKRAQQEDNRRRAALAEQRRKLEEAALANERLRQASIQ